MRWLAAGVTAWLFWDAARAVPSHAGVSTFGDPPVQAALWAAVGIGFVIALVAAPDRLAVARRVTLALLLATLLGQAGVPAGPGVRLVLLAATLLAAAPFLRASTAAWGALAAVGLAVPGLLGAVYPHGALQWLSFTLPPVAMAWLVPSLYPGDAAARPARLVLAATAAFCALAVWSYAELADGLDLPLVAVLGTRLRVMGLHPNLAVPHLVATLLLGAALAAGARGAARGRDLALLVPVLVALGAVRSRTGFAAAAAGLALLWLGRRSGRLPRLALPVAAAGVVAVLALPVTGLSDTSIGVRSTSMIEKSVSFRSAMWALGRRTAAAAPWHGNGPGTTYLQAAQAVPGALDGYAKDDHPHSIVLSMAEALGWPGVLGLALLLALGLRRPRGADVLSDACRLGVLVVFAANAMDLGGAQDTLYPSLAFLLVGLAEARGTPPPREARGRSLAVRPVVLVPALACAALGLALTVAASAERRAGEALDAAAAAAPDDAATRTAAVADAREALARADRFAPLDPSVPLLRARLAALGHDATAEIAALEQALARLPRSAALAHRLAAAVSRVAPDDPRVDARLADALRWDPYGVDGWRRQMDRCRIALLRDRTGEALDALVAALLVNPYAAAGSPTRGAEGGLVVHPAGADQPGLALGDVLAALERLRAGLSDDAASAVRIEMRMVEVPQALGAYETAEANRLELLADEEVYFSQAKGRIAVERGDWDAAVAPLAKAADLGYFWMQAALVEALSHASGTDRAAFLAAFEEGVARMRTERVDCVFDLKSLRQMLAARRRWLEREGDAVGAAHAADALAFAER